MASSVSPDVSPEQNPHLRSLTLSEPAARQQSRACPRQLALPLRAGQQRLWPPVPTPPRLPPRPPDAELSALLLALVEVADGRRPLSQLRQRLTGPLYRLLQAEPTTPLGQHLCVRQLHCTEGNRPGVLEVFARVEVLPEGRSYAVAASLHGHWYGWPVAAFGVVLPTPDQAAEAEAQAA